MRHENLLCHKKKFKPVTTDSTHGLPVYPNLLKGREITGLNQAWASDITYVQLQHEHIFLAVILDLYSRKCIGWELSRSIRSDLAMSALAKALKNRTKESLEGLMDQSVLLVPTVVVILSALADRIKADKSNETITIQARSVSILLKIKKGPLLFSFPPDFLRS